MILLAVMHGTIFLISAGKEIPKNVSQKYSKTIPRRQGVLWIYGDSISYLFHNAVANTPLCKQLFESCDRTYNYLFPVDDQIDAMKTYSCKYFSRCINCRYHELHCKTRELGDVSYRHDFQFGSGTERNGDFEKIHQGFDHTLKR